MKVKKKKQKSVLLALSGGVDSSVSALLLKKQGYKVFCCFLKCFSDTKDPITGECAWIKEKQMAQKAASKLDLPFITLDLEKEYKKQIVLPMIKTYEKGLTPNPDISCNTIIKFPWLLKEANKRKIDYIATGHYARIKKIKKGFDLLAGKDKSKDQSYFLYELNQSILSRSIFPVGNLIKKQVRQIAKNNNLPNWDKHGTSGICFIGKVNIKSFLEKSIKHKLGSVKDPEGKVIGSHHGAFYYTIGQRAHSGIGIEFEKSKEDNKKWFIAKKMKNNILIIAPDSHNILKKDKIYIKSLHLINPKEIISGNVKARIRHLGKLLNGKLIKSKKGYSFMLKTPASGIADGQHLVIYNKEKVIGGGEIKLI